MNSAVEQLQPSYRPDIDGLRAIAIIAVVLFHAFPQVLTGGFVGVDIFFVISGYLISTIILKNLEKGNFSFIDFYRRRIRRIFPALILVLLFCLGVGWYVLLADEYFQLGKHVTSGALFLSNLTLWSEAGYFDNAAETKPLLHLWSLGIEEQFYLAWPLMAWLAWRMKFSFLWISLFLFLISFSMDIGFILNEDTNSSFYLPYSRFWELMTGGMLAWISLQQLKRQDSAPEGKAAKLGRFLTAHASQLSFLGLAMLVLSILEYSKTLNFPGAWALVPTLGTAMIIYAGPGQIVNRTFLSSRILVGIGLISYPLYLWHWPLLSLSRIVEESTPNAWIRMACIILAFILATLTYQLLEKQVRRKNSAIKTIYLILAMTVTGLLGYIVHANDGFDFRISNVASAEKIIEHPLAPIGETLRESSCTSYYPELSKSEFARECSVLGEGKPEVLFVGDSHVLRNLSYESRYYNGHSVLRIYGTSCLPFTSDQYIERKDCQKKYDDLVNFLDQNRDIRTVVISAYWSKAIASEIGNRGINWRNADKATEQDREEFIRNGSRFLQAALTGGRHVIFIQDVPDLDFNIRSCFTFRPFMLTDHDPSQAKCSMSFDSYARRNAPYTKVINDLLERFPQVKVFDPTSSFCTSHECMAIQNGIPLYYNGDHVNYIGARIVMDSLVHKYGNDLFNTPHE